MHSHETDTLNDDCLNQIIPVDELHVHTKMEKYTKNIWNLRCHDFKINLMVLYLLGQSFLIRKFFSQLIKGPRFKQQSKFHIVTFWSVNALLIDS